MISVRAKDGTATYLMLCMAGAHPSAGFSHGALSGCLICTFALHFISFGSTAGAYLVNVAVKQPSSHCRNPAVAERLWDETDRQIKVALAKS